MTVMSLSIWHWLAGLVAVILLTTTKGVVRGGIMIILLTLLAARVAYLAVT